MKFEKISNKTLRDEFAMSAMQGLLAAETDASEMDEWQVSQLAYRQADAMLVTREEVTSELNQATGPADIDRYFYIGGPWHGKYLLGENAPYVACEPGQYHRHSLEINGKGGKAVYVWSESSYEEAVDLVLGCMK